MQDRPTIAELLEAVQEYLIRELLPLLEKKGENELSYKTLVSWNMLGVIERELRDGERLLDQELQELQKLLQVLEPKGATALQALSYQEKLEWGGKLNHQLAEKIRREKLGPAHREIWQHVYENVKRKIAIINPRFSLE